MAGSFIDFAEVEKLADIEQLAEMLGLKTQSSRTQLRCECPVHGGDQRTLAISPMVRSRKGSMGVFFCQKSQQGGDRLALVAHCMDIGQQDAAHFIAQQFGAEDSDSTVKSTSTVSKARATPAPARGRPQPAPFDPQAFAEKLAYSEELDGIVSEEDAQAFRIGVYRGHIYVPAVYASGAVAGWWKLVDGKLEPPSRGWLPDNVVAFPKKTA